MFARMAPGRKETPAAEWRRRLASVSKVDPNAVELAVHRWLEGARGYPIEADVVLVVVMRAIKAGEVSGGTAGDADAGA